MKSTFRPKFNADDVDTLQSRYDSMYDQKLTNLVRPVRERMFLTNDDLRILGEWKSPRIRSRLARNSDEDVRAATQFALESS